MTSPQCKLEVRASKLGQIGRVDWHHLFLVFTDATGTEYYYRGGPGDSPGASGQLGQVSGGASGSGSESASRRLTSGSSGSGINPSRSSGAPFGTIITESGPYTAGTIDWDPEAVKITVSEGVDTCRLQNELEREMTDIAATNTRYRPLGPNSNSAVTTVLRNLGITPKLPPGVLAPGSGMHIRQKSKAKKLFTKRKLPSICISCALRK